MPTSVKSRFPFARQVTSPFLGTLSLSISLFYLSHPQSRKKDDGSFLSFDPIHRPMKSWTCLPFKWTPSLSQPFWLICIFVACLCEPLAAKKASKSVGVSGARPWRITNVWNPIQRLNSGGPSWQEGAGEVLLLSKIQTASGYWGAQTT